MRGVNVPGYHFHFITQDKVAGGHLLDCRLQRVKIEIDCTSRFYMTLPGSKEFYEADLAKTKQTELEKVEKQ
jgi:acetolactate decarboxylase